MIRNHWTDCAKYSCRQCLKTLSSISMTPKNDFAAQHFNQSVRLRAKICVRYISQRFNPSEATLSNIDTRGRWFLKTIQETIFTFNQYLLLYRTQHPSTLPFSFLLFLRLHSRSIFHILSLFSIQMSGQKLLHVDFSWRMAPSSSKGSPQQLVLFTPTGTSLLHFRWFLRLLLDAYWYPFKALVT